MAETPDPEQAAALDRVRLANETLRHYLGTGDRPAGDRAIDLYRACLAAPAAAPYRRLCTGNLLVALHTRFSLLHDPGDLDELISIGSGQTAPDPPNAQDAAILGMAYGYRYELGGRPDDLDAEIASYRRAAGLPQGDVDDRAATLNSLGLALDRRHAATGSRQDLADAEHAYRDALRHLPPADSGAGITSNLATSRLRTFLVDSDPTALRESLDLLYAALADSPPGSPARPSVLGNLAEVLRTGAEHLPGGIDIDDLIRVSRQALDATPMPHAGHAKQLAGLGVSLRIAAESRADAVLLQESVGLLREALRHTPPGSEFRVDRLISLANALHRHAEWTGDPEILDEVIATLRQVLEASRPVDPSRTRGLGNLALALRERHEQTGDLAALSEAADLARQALGAPDTAQHEYARHLNNFGVVLQSWDERSGDPAAAAESVDAAREALALLPDGSSVRGDRLNTLANALRAHFRSSGDPAHLEEAVACLEKAAEITPYGDPVLALVLSNLGSVWLTMNEVTDDPDALDHAVVALGRAVWATSDEDAAHAVYLSSYADALLAAYAEHGDPMVLSAAQDAYRQAARTESMPALRRVMAAWNWAAAAVVGGRWDEALEGYELAVGLLPVAASSRLARDDQEHGLSQVHGLAAEAAACAVNAGHPERAALLLEQGRGVLLGRTMAVRDELARLRITHPDTAERYQRLRDRIDALESAAEEGFNGVGNSALGRIPGPATDRRHESAAQWDRVVTEIRGLPGFADFLAVPSSESLLACAEHGPVVLAYSCGIRSDALILHAGRIDLVPLPHATPEAVEEQVSRLDEALEAAMDPARERQAQQAVSKVLAWTWDHITEPVLNRLGLADTPADGDWPQLWWSPGGALASLPLHAAGHHTQPPEPRPRTVLDRVVSSYTPTVRALAYSRARASGPQSRGGLLAVALPDTPGAQPLGGAKREVKALERLLPTRVLTGPLATFDSVLHALPDHPYVHFACHGVSDPGDPSNGRLLVHDHRERALTVREIARLDLSGARLAVLSACETSRGTGRLADESIHITSAFQIAGYPHAIGTLWPVHDLIAVRITTSLYRSLCEGGHGAPQGVSQGPSQGLDADRAAVALHHAVRQCRDAFRDSPSLWAAHVHAGA